MLAAQTVFAGGLFLMAVFAAKPVFLTPLQDAPHATLTSGDIMTTLSVGTQAAKDFKAFWKNTKKHDVRMCVPVTVGGASDAKSIANHFKSMFAVSPLLNTAGTATHEMCDTETVMGESTVEFTAKEVHNVIRNMQRGKSPGYDGLSIEHLKYAGIHLPRSLAMFFTLCLRHGYLPEQLTRTVVIPLVKNKTGDLSDFANYRPISLATVIAKVLDSLINAQLCRYIKLNDAQFGFRPGLSTDSAILCVKQAVQYYTDRNTPIYGCFLDVSKAFDLVVYDILWDKLASTGLPAECVALLRYWYSSQVNRVRWAGEESDEYRLQCGVRQGGLSSPILFNLYINELIDGLSRTRVGCHMGDKCFNNISYADDMVLLGPSVNSIRQLLALCEGYAAQRGLRYNATKSELVVFKARKYNREAVPEITLGGVPLKVVDRVKYLGHMLTSDLSDDPDLERERRAMAVRGNMIARRFARCSNEVKLTLFKAYCQTFYTCSLWVKFTQRAYNAIRVQYNNILRMLLRLPRHCSASRMFAEARTDDFFAVRRKRVGSLLSRMRGSSNGLLRALAERLDSPLTSYWLGYAPDTDPYKAIMAKVAEKLNKKFLTGSTEQELNEKLYEKSKGQVLKHHIIWVVWKEKENNTWKFSIRSTELAHLAKVNSTVTRTLPHNRHLLSGFLAVQLAVSEEILAAESKELLRHKIKLKAMPISPLMRKEAVRQAMVWVLLCFTVAFIPPVMEVSELVVHETSNEYKRALCMRNVGAACIYLGWLSYLHMTTLPILILATLTLILIFRWVWIFVAFLFVAIYITVMAMTAFIMCMFQNKPHIAAIWSALFTLLQLFLADLLVNHGFDSTTSFTVVLHILLPPLGLVHGFHGFALLDTGREHLTFYSKRIDCEGIQYTKYTIYEHHTLIIWIMMILAYFGLLMLLQRTIGSDRAVGGQVSWRSIIFKQAEDKNKLRTIQNPLGNERDPLQEIDELVAKAISFHSVTKSVMGIGIIRRVTLDVYRGEYTLFFAEKIQERMLNRIEDLITGLTLPDDGSVNMLGNDMAALRKAGKRVAAMQGMLGYCHRVGFLVAELSVQETLRFFIRVLAASIFHTYNTHLCLWDQSDEDIEGYTLTHTPRLYKECDLQDVRDTYVRNLGTYYKAQLCWAIAMILEPRIVFIQSFIDGRKYISVINDKIVKYRTHLTIVKISFTTSVLEHADRVFLFDRKVLVFGGSPAYMFFKYGREYRVRMNFRVRGSLDNEKVEELVDRAMEMGGQVRAYVGTLLILRLPTSPTDVTAEFVKEITENANHYGITSLNISLPDSEEIHKRAINDSRKQIISYTGYGGYTNASEQALRELTKPKLWKRKKSPILTITLLKQTLWKYVSFYIHYRLFLIITVDTMTWWMASSRESDLPRGPKFKHPWERLFALQMLSAIVTGAIIGVFLSFQLNEMETIISSSRLLGEKMTVEALEQSTTLVLRVYNTDDAISVATGYALSTTGARSAETQNMFYTALPYTESSTEYLMLRAIDSPQHYVYAYAYGMELKDESGILDIHVLYSPIHHDTAAAARSLARVYMALLRHYTKSLDADIEVTDDPLVLDSSPSQKKTKVPPLVIHFMLIITIAHITLLPTMEHGLIRHMQVHAMNFSPARYWFSLFCCDIILYWTLVFIITTVLFCVMYWVAPLHFLHRDLIVIPFMLIMYGFSCVPQAYLFSLGPSAALNSMSFVISNIIFGEASVISQFIQGGAFTYAEKALSLSPQYNVANAFVQITKIFVYNSECVIFNNKKLCKSNVLHKCCKKCGIMQRCFERISYLSKAGILDEILWTVYHSIFFSSLLIIWEYQVLQRLWYYARERWFPPEEPPMMMETSGGTQERWDVEAKSTQMKQKRIRRNIKTDTFGENLLVNNLSKRVNGSYKLSRIFFGIGKGEALSLVGQSMGGRLELCEIIAGFKMPTSGSISAMSRWSLTTDPHMYSRNVAFSCFEYCPMPPWMTVYDSLWMMGVLRGIPQHYVHEEVANLLDALELDESSNVNVFRLHQNEKTRLNFAVAVIGAPPVLVLDEFTAYQQYSVDRAMFYILYHLRKQGHALLVSSASIENHMAVTNRLGILLNGQLVDVDHIDVLVARYSSKGYTVVVHLKDEVDIEAIFGRHFVNFSVNDVSGVLANVQVKDSLNYAEIFSKMEELVQANQTVYSYVITVTAMDYIYNDILEGYKIQIAPEEYFWPCLKFLARKKKKVDLQKLLELEKFRKKYDIVSLKELPWSVIFRR
ncbi:uncharacterized protein LOC134756238 [Cydia strobilella]|uniref:uncharacterized protein LOC134756238 n=1 Tax=Cydia strobilella TaxID=1100964 RepID=UPI0030056374